MPRSGHLQCDQQDVRLQQPHAHAGPAGLGRLELQHQCALACDLAAAKSGYYTSRTSVSTALLSACSWVTYSAVLPPAWPHTDAPRYCMLQDRELSWCACLVCEHI